MIENDNGCADLVIWSVICTTSVEISCADWSRHRAAAQLFSFLRQIIVYFLCKSCAITEYFTADAQPVQCIKAIYGPFCDEFCADLLNFSPFAQPIIIEVVQGMVGIPESAQLKLEVRKGSRKLNCRDIIRERCIAARDRLSMERRQAFSEKISERIADSEVFAAAKTIMLYKGVRGEVRLHALEKIAQAVDKRFVYPLCIGKGEMIAMEPLGKESWQTGAYGILEPVRELSREIAPTEIDLIICPCTAFDAQCNRLGMGTGYYDRFLLKCTRAVVIAAAFEVQRVAAVPAERWDIPMEKVFTEKQFYAKI